MKFTTQVHYRNLTPERRVSRDGFVSGAQRLILEKSHPFVTENFSFPHYLLQSQNNLQLFHDSARSKVAKFE